MPQLKVQNFYSTALTSDIVGTGDTSFTVTIAPTYTSGFLVISPNNVSLREIVYFHNVVGNTVSVRAENRGQGGTTARAHTSSESVAMKDIAEIFNLFSDSISQCFFVEKTGWMTVKVWGGTVFYNWNPVTVADTSLTLTDNQTNYIKYSYPTNTISVDTTNSGNIKARVTTVSWAITSIQYYVAKESYIDFTVTITWALPSQTGQTGKALTTDGTNVSWGTFMKPTGNGNNKIIGTNGTGIITEYVKWTSSQVLLGDLSLDSIDNISWNRYTATPYESTIVANDPVWITSDGLFKCTTENKSSINISAWSVVTLGTVKLSATRTLFMYYSVLTVYARVWTLTWDTMAFWTQVTIWTWATWWIYGGCCEIWTDKVVTVWWDWTTASANNANHTVLTISGTTITVNTTYVYSMPKIGGGSVKSIQTVCKVRNDCYAWGYFSVNTGYNFINSVSGTVITINGTPFITWVMSLSSWNWVYLSDNLIGFPAWGNWVPTSMNMYAVTPWAVTITTTYTGASSDGTGTATVYLARVSDTEYVATFSGTNQNTVKYTKPPSWTALIVTNIVANGAVGYPVVSVSDSCFWVVNGTTLSVYTRSGQLLWTITGISLPSTNQHFQYFNTSNARMVYINWTNGTVRIINLARVFYLGIANNSVGWVLFKGLLTVTGVVTNQLYYVQADWTIWETFSWKLIWKWIATNTLLVW